MSKGVLAMSLVLKSGLLSAEFNLTFRITLNR